MIRIVLPAFFFAFALGISGVQASTEAEQSCAWVKDLPKMESIAVENGVLTIKAGGFENQFQLVNLMEIFGVPVPLDGREAHVTAQFAEVIAAMQTGATYYYMLNTEPDSVYPTAIHYGPWGEDGDVIGCFDHSSYGVGFYIPDATS